MRGALINFFQGLAFLVMCMMLVKLGVQGVYHAPVIQSALTRTPTIEMRGPSDVSDSSYLTKKSSLSQIVEEHQTVELPVASSLTESAPVVTEKIESADLPFLSLSVQAVFEKVDAFDESSADLGEVLENPFTIQLVTYVNHQRATEEVMRLNEMGMNAFIISSGNYHQVCINRFIEKDKAVTALRELKQHETFQVYYDAFVRPVLR